VNYWLTESAKDDLLSIWDYTADRWNEEWVDLYIDALVARFDWLTKNVGLWKPRPEIGEGLYSYLEQSHVIVFWEQRDGIEILRVLHGRMGVQRHL
jgi:toxin ParE1/3/4